MTRFAEFAAIRSELSGPTWLILGYVFRRDVAAPVPKRRQKRAAGPAFIAAVTLLLAQHSVSSVH